MRLALNNLQATYSGYRFVNQENVFEVYDQPHPLHVKNMICNILDGKFDEACAGLKLLYILGHSPTDIITTLFRIIKNYDIPEYLKLEFMKETGFAHMRICDGVGSLLQLCALLAKFSLVLLRTLLLNGPCRGHYYIHGQMKAIRWVNDKGLEEKVKDPVWPKTLLYA